MDKARLDVLVSALGYSREKAKALIMAGEVLVNNVPATKAGNMYPVDAAIRIKSDVCPYVSRGGLKLEKAMRSFSINLGGKVCADIGASSGGFTDCMLINGADKVYAIDVGYGQLDWKLRSDERVIVMERTNARYLTEDDIQGIDFVSVDVSFISLAHIFPAIMNITNASAEVVTLIKPQFEAGRENVGKKGVVRDKNVHIGVINNVLAAAAKNGLYAHALDYSPIKGPNGNIEYIAYYNKSADVTVTGDEIVNLVQQAHDSL